MPTKAQLSYPPSEDPPPVNDERSLMLAAAKKLGLDPESIIAARASRVSFDARRRHRVWRVSVDVWTTGDEHPPERGTDPPTYSEPLSDALHTVVIGSGPAGLFCALDLMSEGINVTVLERGRDVQTRRKPIAKLHRGEAVDPNSNYCFGEGGAGTYSDGKLYTRSGRKKDIRGVLETLVAHGASEEILSSWRPHVGSNRLPEVVAAMRETILRSGGKVRFGSLAEEIETDPSSRAITAVHTRDLDTDSVERIACDAIVLATGHSAMDALEMAARAGATLEPKGFAMGVRIEHPQPWLDEGQYGGLRAENSLPASFYELTTEVRERGVYSFCMCPGGFIVPTTVAPNRHVLNGMSLSRRDSPYANSGIVVSIEPEDWCGERAREWGFDKLMASSSDQHPIPENPGDDPLFGVRLQHALEERAAVLGGGANRAPSQRADIVAEGSSQPGPALTTSYRPGVTPIDLADLFPQGMLLRLRAALPDFEKRISGFSSEIGQLLGVESRTSSPVRIARDPESYQALPILNLYPCGEGAGFAGGIVSAAIDGRRIAAAISNSRV
ncbi:MAG: putative FAD-dependent dehydrogenase [Planctomycetota bacterium]|jgi:uncharacterized FAD-dependent dehydrogenase